MLAADRPANGESSDSNRLNYWLRLIAEYGLCDEGRKAPVLIVVTRNDLDRAKSNREEIDEPFRRHGGANGSAPMWSKSCGGWVGPAG